MTPSNRKRLFVVLLALVVVAAAQLILQTSPNEAGQNADQQTPTSVSLVTAPGVPIKDEQPPASVKSAAEISSALPVMVAVSAHTEPPPPAYVTGLIDLSNSLEETLEAFKEQFAGATAADITQRVARAAAGDAAAAFWLAMFFEECANSPRSYEILDRRLAQIEVQMNQYFTNNPNVDPNDWPDKASRNAVEKFEMCGVIPADTDLVLDAFNYLGLAADLGHMTAQRAYHAHGFSLLMNAGTMYRSPLGFEQPLLIAEFKQRMGQYAQALSGSGHPHALTLLARMYYQGDVYDKDLMLAYAYAQAAVMEGSAGIVQSGEAWKGIIQYLLTVDDLAKAEELARDILKTHRKKNRSDDLE